MRVKCANCRRVFTMDLTRTDYARHQCPKCGEVVFVNNLRIRNDAVQLLAQAVRDMLPKPKEGAAVCRTCHTVKIGPSHKRYCWVGKAVDLLGVNV